MISILFFVCNFFSILFIAFNRLELAEERALSLTGQKTANECMEILKVKEAKT